MNLVSLTSSSPHIKYWCFVSPCVVFSESRYTSVGAVIWSMHRDVRVSPLSSPLFLIVCKEVRSAQAGFVFVREKQSGVRSFLAASPSDQSDGLRSSRSRSGGPVFIVGQKRLIKKPSLYEGASEDVYEKWDYANQWEAEKGWSHLLADASWTPGDESVVIVIGQKHFFTLPLSSAPPPPPASAFPVFFFPVVAPPVGLPPFSYLHSPFSCPYNHTVGVTVGCAASCLLSPCATGSDRRNYYISCSLLCICEVLSHRRASVLTTATLQGFKWFVIIAFFPWFTSLTSLLLKVL